ncbi:MAG: hypothetical protein RMJ48_01690 [Roseiflexaceae bacterium]|nr:hypothetical protein [Roseiflexaceae bacterium]
MNAGKGIPKQERLGEGANIDQVRQRVRRFRQIPGEGPEVIRLPRRQLIGGNGGDHIVTPDRVNTPFFARQRPRRTRQQRGRLAQRQPALAPELAQQGARRVVRAWHTSPPCAVSFSETPDEKFVIFLASFDGMIEAPTFPPRRARAHSRHNGVQRTRMLAGVRIPACSRLNGFFQEALTRRRTGGTCDCASASSRQSVRAT